MIKSKRKSSFKKIPRREPLKEMKPVFSRALMLWNKLKSKTINHSYQPFNHPFSHLIRGTKISKKRFKQFCLYIRKSLSYSMNCLKGPSIDYLRTKQVILTINNKSKITIHFLYLKFIEIMKKMLLLGLDETIIHSCNEN